MGGGIGISCHAPIRIATEKTVYAMPETAIGFYCDVGATYFLPRIKGDNTALGLYLGLTGHRLKSQELLAWDLATHFIPTALLSDLRQYLIEQVQDHHSKEDVFDMVSKF